MMTMSSQNIQIVAFVLLMIFSGFSSFVEYRKEKKITGKLVLYSVLFLLATGFGAWAIASVNDKPEFSIVEVCAGGINPNLSSTDKEDSLSLIVMVCNKGNIPINKLNDKGLILMDVNGELLPLSVPHPSLSAHVVVNPGELERIFYPMNGDTKTIVPNAKYYFCFKMYYSNKITERDSIINIYSISPSQINKPLFSPDSLTSARIENFLVSKGLW